MELPWAKRQERLGKIHLRVASEGPKILDLVGEQQAAFADLDGLGGKRQQFLPIRSDWELIRKTTGEQAEVDTDETPSSDPAT